MKRILFLIITSTFFNLIVADVWVNGYTRSNGTHVKGHYRSNPNGTKSDNWSTYGNTNPHTGKTGTRKYNDYEDYQEGYDEYDDYREGSDEIVDYQEYEDYQEGYIDKDNIQNTRHINTKSKDRDIGGTIFAYFFLAIIHLIIVYVIFMFILLLYTFIIWGIYKLFVPSKKEFQYSSFDLFFIFGATIIALVLFFKWFWN